MNRTLVDVAGTEVSVWEAGSGRPILLIHGLSLDHRGIAAGMEPLFAERDGWRRIYLDLPGMGDTRGTSDLASADALVRVLDAVVERLIGGKRFAVLGQSYGGYLALGLLRVRGGQIGGLAVVVPVLEPDIQARVLPPTTKLVVDDEAMRTLPDAFLDVYRGLIVRESMEMARALARDWLPAIQASDRDFVERLQSEGYALSSHGQPVPHFPGPALILCGRHDAVVGFEQAMSLHQQFPRATAAVLDGAGHLVQLEREALSNALISDWLDRVDDDVADD